MSTVHPGHRASRLLRKVLGAVPQSAPTISIRYAASSGVGVIVGVLVMVGVGVLVGVLVGDEGVIVGVAWRQPGVNKYSWFALTGGLVPPVVSQPTEVNELLLLCTPTVNWLSL